MPGMEVTLPARGSLFAWRRLAPAVAFAMVLVIVSSFGYQQYLYAQPLAAYVTLDSAGSIELEVNAAGIVKGATGIDEAGQKALSSVDYMKKPAGKVVAALVKAQDPEKTSDVVVAVVPVQSGAEAEKLEKSVSKLEKKVVDGAGSSAGASLTSLRLDPEVRESAKQLGISAGRAALWAISKHDKSEKGPEEQPGTVAPWQDTPGKSGETLPPGQEKKEGILDTIKGALPQVDPKEIKDRSKDLKDITKNWVDQVVEQIKEKDQKSTPPGQAKQGDDKSGSSKEKGSSSPSSGNGQGSQGQGSGQNSGEQSGKDKEKGKGTSSAPSQEWAAASQNTGAERRSIPQQILEGLLRRLPRRNE